MSSAVPHDASPADAFKVVDAPDWHRRLSRSDKGAIRPTVDNVVAILTHHPEWQPVLAYDEMAGRIVKLAAPPIEGGLAGEWNDRDDSHLILWLGRNFGFEPTVTNIVHAVTCAADARRFHRLREYLQGLVWDGSKRLDVWLSAYLGAPETAYTALVGAKWMISAVARALNPGCQADHVLTLEGRQGVGKSSAFRVLGGEWFSDASIDVHSKDTFDILRDAWIVEIAELASFSRAEASAVKRFLTQRVHHYRPSYGRRAIKVPRACVFGGTVNERMWGRDETGNRRFWPVEVTRADLDELAADRDQLWAEAVQRYKAGERWFLETAEHRQLAEEEQELRQTPDALDDKIFAWMRDNPDRTELTLATVMECLGYDVGRWSPVEMRRVAQSLLRCGWQKVRARDGESRSRVYRRTDGSG